MNDGNKPSLIYTYPSKSTFILRDIDLLSGDYRVLEDFFSTANKKKVPFQFLRQFFFLLGNLSKVQGIFCHFAGYHSMLPVLFAKLFRKPCFIIVAGTDAACFPSFGYGNFTRKMLGFATKFSLQRATQILPVHESLYFQSYDYYTPGAPSQGYSVFAPNTKPIPYTPVYYGYDAKAFRILENTLRKKMSFLTVGSMGDPKAAKRKGYDLVKELAAIRKECHFTLVGFSDKEYALDESNITFLPYQDQESLVHIFNAHQFYFQLSIMEGFPNALAEAMLCGCIPIGSNVSGIPFIIGDTGYILTHRNLDKLAQIIATISSATDAELQKRSKEARNRIATHFTLLHRKNALIAALKNHI